MTLPRPGFSAYITIGWPNPGTFEKLVETLSECVDFFEFGVPTPRPIYDGPTIRETHAEALKSVSGWRDALKLLSRLEIGDKRPTIIMAYMSDHLGHLREFHEEAASAGARCILYPDLPFEHPEKLWLYVDESERVGLKPCFFASSRFPHRWLLTYAALRPLFIYLGLQPATGVKLPIAVEKNVRLAKKLVGDVYLLAGFAIRDSETARRLIEVGADAVVVGSAIIRAAKDRGLDEAKRLACSIHQAVHAERA
ncbi:tryptophan synthase, alpha subunit [Pyrolobus fumarii 1A]|uniref:tryptophan synthase n=1 Tax=Pyrolobus fumarii (strain DSM 11204 / 1A) TaxID=694429 RepID=G0EER9_PYRF1|nr:tryptophan synthase subunit alpha [Pyrolobus fumarii]AEM38891.1 tryptophan synthase, alpha subunit [Pyrolobus fumarii 1A]